nr:MAG TPA: hypothetical protein [Bacteriophage sp.]
MSVPLILIDTVFRPAKRCVTFPNSKRYVPCRTWRLRISS